ncbi:MAG TPA: D-alanyl-D-alanine carboxypeptidase, partial [Burkholderiaceae bacterium]|nr:D-alanyl-D-alanine carboxypeptidase [Burkholderiaceae bacterium]
IREINKTSNNVGARQLLLSLGASGTPALRSPLVAAQGRVAQWLRAQGLGDGDLRVEQGSGQSRNERGKPLAMVQLLRNAWHAAHAKVFVDSLPVAGVDGTLAQRMRSGAAAGNAFLKTGTLSDTRALAGYVRARSWKVYAVAVLVNHPKATLATPALDAFIEWVARNG